MTDTTMEPARMTGIGGLLCPRCGRDCVTPTGELHVATNDERCVSTTIGFWCSGCADGGISLKLIESNGATSAYWRHAPAQPVDIGDSEPARTA